METPAVATDPHQPEGLIPDSREEQMEAPAAATDPEGDEHMEPPNPSRQLVIASMGSASQPADGQLAEHEERVRGSPEEQMGPPNPSHRVGRSDVEIRMLSRLAPGRTPASWRQGQPVGRWQHLRP